MQTVLRTAEKMETFGVCVCQFCNGMGMPAALLKRRMHHITAIDPT
jgi:hypothetical protein